MDGAGLDGNGWVARIQQVSGLGAVAVMRIVGRRQAGVPAPLTWIWLTCRFGLGRRESWSQREPLDILERVILQAQSRAQYVRHDLHNLLRRGQFNEEIR